MRRATHNVGVLQEGENILLSFGYDFCAEHERGTQGINSSFGVSSDEEDLTVSRYAVTRADDTNLWLFEATRIKESRLYLIGGRSPFWRETPAEFAKRYCESLPQTGKPEALWDENSFMFSVPAESGEAAIVRAIHAALLAKNALIYRSGSGGPFGGAGLVIVRRSTIPQPIIDQMQEAFLDRALLKEAAEKTGIRQRVEAWGKTRGGWGGPFFALSPKWMFENRKAESAHPVIFWLNPTDQQNNNFGWFTVEELDQWIEGRGPIPMKKATTEETTDDHRG